MMAEFKILIFIIMVCLKIATLNVYGLRDQTKLKNVQNFFYKEKLSILLLQETHYLKNSDNWEKLWKGKSYWAGMSRHSSGVGVIFNEKQNVKIKKTELDKEGRFIIINCEIEKEEYTIMCVYLPDIPSLRHKYIKNKLLPKLNTLQARGKLILGGDFNCVESEQNDRLGGTTNPCHIKGMEMMEPYLKNLDLNDIWENKIAGFTWYNHDKSIASRIDRIYTQPETKKQIIKIENKEVHFTDHNTVIITVEVNKNQQGKGYWKMNTMVLNSKEYESRIVGFWKCWQKEKGKYSKNAWWDLGKFEIQQITKTHCIKETMARKKKIEDLNKILIQEKNSKNRNYNKIRETQAELIDISDRDAYGTQIRSGQKLAEDLEVPGEYFYRMERLRKNEKRIQELEINGEINENEEKILAHIRDYYKEIYTNEPIDRGKAQQILQNTEKKCTEGQKQKLSETLTKDELHKALKLTEKNKSPGMDGIPYEFYLKFWETIGNDFTEIINHVFEKGNLTDSQKSAVISLIPKKGDISKIENWRPISLLNCDLKIATKTIAIRLENILPELINKTQTCSIRDRQAHHHALLIREIIACANITEKPTYILSFDQQKAFDRVNWEYLEMTLQKFDFPKGFLNYIKTIYNDIRATVAVNGHQTHYFKIERGLRQGCPLSLLLYLLIAETLGNHIQKSKEIEGYKIPLLNEKIKQIQFADDTTVILEKFYQIKYLLKIFDTYEKASGAKLNKNKTRGIHINHPTNGNLKCPIEIQWNKSDTKILGIIFTPDEKINQQLNWETVLEKLNKRALFLTARNLSLKGKTQVINTILLSKAWLVGRIYPPIQEITKKINKTIFRYIWSKEHETVPRVALIQPIENGGLGVLSVEDQSAALQIKDLNDIDARNPPYWTYIARFFAAHLIKRTSQRWANLREHHTNLEIPFHLQNIIKYLYRIYPAINKQQFTVKNIRKCLITTTDTNPKTSVKQKIQSTVCRNINWDKATKANYKTLGSPKHGNVYFKLLHNALPSGENLKHWFRNNTFNTTCKMCGKESETSIHIFVCPHWGKIWTNIKQILKKINNKPISIEEIILAQYSANTQSCNTFVFCAMDLIYTARNKMIHEEIKQTPEEVLDKILMKIKNDLQLRYRVIGNSFLTKIDKLASDANGVLTLQF